MGLDCTAYSKATVLPDDPSRDPWDTEGVVRAFAYAGFERTTRGLVDHDVAGADGRFIAEHDYDISEGTRFGWRAGSYSGYGAFRAALARLAGYEATAAWSDPDAYADRPFFELVNFADNEGSIGPDAARDLAADFHEHRDAFHAEHAGTYWPETYDEWIKGLDMAAGGGLVRLH